MQTLYIVNIWKVPKYTSSVKKRCFKGSIRVSLWNGKPPQIEKKTISNCTLHIVVTETNIEQRELKPSSCFHGHLPPKNGHIFCRYNKNTKKMVEKVSFQLSDWFKHFLNFISNPLDAGLVLNVFKTFRIPPLCLPKYYVHLIYILCPLRKAYLSKKKLQAAPGSWHFYRVWNQSLIDDIFHKLFFSMLHNLTFDDNE